MKRVKAKLASIRTTVASALNKAMVIYDLEDLTVTVAVAILAKGLHMVYSPLPWIILPSLFLGYEVWKKVRRARQ